MRSGTRGLRTDVPQKGEAFRRGAAQIAKQSSARAKRSGRKEPRGVTRGDAVRVMDRQRQARRPSRYPGDQVSRSLWRGQGAGAAKRGTVARTKPRSQQGAANKKATKALRHDEYPQWPWATSFDAASRADRSRMRRFRQDSPPRLYMYTPSGAKDGEIAHPAQGARLHRKRSRNDRQHHTHAHPHAPPHTG